jgi:hypothetical protein
VRSAIWISAARPLKVALPSAPPEDRAQLIK